MQHVLATVFLSLVVWLAALPTGTRADDDTPMGLMWNRTGLPAVFPLQMKTTPGADYLVILTDAETETDVLAAYAKGGAFFRVLVPPGRYAVRIHYGSDWQGEERLFGTGPDTGLVTLPEPLRFGVRGLGTKSGHLVDLRGVVRRGEESAQVTPLDLCQGYRTVVVDPGDLPLLQDPVPDYRTLLPAELYAFNGGSLPYRSFLSREQLSPADRAFAQLRFERLHAPKNRQPATRSFRFELSTRSRPCW